MYYEEESWNSEIASPLAPRIMYDSIIEEGEKEEESGLKSGRSHQHNSEDFGSISSPLTNGNDQKKDFPQDIEVKPIQLELWETTLINDPDEVYKLWFKCFDVFQQISLWNKLKFPVEYFKEVESKTDSEITKNKPLTSQGRGSLLKFVKDGPLSNKKIQRILRLKLSRKKTFKHLYEVCLPLKDYKSLLWLPMPLEDKIKLTLCQKDPKEAEVMIALLTAEVKDTEYINKELENSLNSLLLNKYLTASEIMCTLAKIRACPKLSYKENQRLLKYIRLLTKKYKDIQTGINSDVRYILSNLPITD